MRKPSGLDFNDKAQVLVEQLRIKLDRGDELSLDERKFLQNYVATSKYSDFQTFCHHFFPKFPWAWFHEYLMQEINNAIRDGGDIIIEMPPQHCKTLLGATALSAYIFGRFPQKKIAYCTYSQDRADEVCPDILEILDCEDYKNSFPLTRLKINTGKDETLERRRKLKRMRNNHWHNVVSKRGEFKGLGIECALSGYSADVLILDDYVKNHSEAYSQTIRDSRWNWFKTTFMTRSQKKVIRLVFSTRWHTDDIIGRLKLYNDQQEKSNPHLCWKVITYPAIMTSERVGKYSYDPRQEGEYLWPETRKKVYEEQYELNSGSGDWLSLYQQLPLNSQGCVFQADWFLDYNELPTEYRPVVISIDTNLDNRSDFNDDCAFTIWLEWGFYIYLIDFFNKPMSYSEMKDFTKYLISLYPSYTKIIIEYKTNGPALVDELSKEFHSIIGFEPKLNKRQRAELVAPLFKSKRVLLPALQVNPRINTYKTQMLHFTGASTSTGKAREKKDLVDSTSQALLGFLQHNLIPLSNPYKTLPRGNNYGLPLQRKKLW